MWRSAATFACVLCLVVPAAVGGQAFFAADFENGSVLQSDSPPGAFNAFWFPVPANSLTAISAAGHRGAFGMRMTDADSPLALVARRARSD